VTERSAWPSVRLGEVLTSVSREEVVDAAKEYRLLGVRLDGRGPFLRELVTGANTAAKKLFRVAKGDFIYSRLFAWRGAFGVIGEELDDSCVSGEFPTFVPAPNRVDVEFLRYWFRLPATLERVTADCSGSTPLTRNRFKEPYFLALEIPLPPLAEQQRIVARIEALAALIDEARALRQQAVEERRALLHAAARDRLAAIRTSLSPLGEWLDRQRGGIQTGPFGAQLGSADFTDSGRPVLTIGNVQFGGLSTSELKYVSEQKGHTLERYRVEEGDILFARMGTVGRCCVVPGHASGWLINYHIIRVALDQSRVEPRFIHWAIRASRDIDEYLISRIRGATRQGVNSGIVRGLPCRVPPLDHQRTIVAELDALQAQVDALTHLQSETAAELDALLPSIFDRAFKGEL